MTANLVQSTMYLTNLMQSYMQTAKWQIFSRPSRLAFCHTVDWHVVVVCRSGYHQLCHTPRQAVRSIVLLRVELKHWSRRSFSVVWTTATLCLSLKDWCIRFRVPPPVSLLVLTFRPHNAGAPLHWLLVRVRPTPARRLQGCDARSSVAGWHFATILVADARERRLRSTASQTCVVTPTYSTFGDRAFSAGPRLRNSLPSHLKKADLSYSRFQRSLKTFVWIVPLVLWHSVKYFNCAF